MRAEPLPSASETLENSAFDALLWALSRPGRVRTLPEAGEGPIIAALLDRECRAYSADALLVPTIMRSGAEISEIGQADHVFLGAMTSCTAINHLAIGSDFYPDGGATVVIRAKIGTGPAFHLTGPGVDGEMVVRMDGLPTGFWSARMSRMRYPMGFDLLFVDGTSVLGVPRSTTVEAA